jgi:UDP-N-acetyl-2-amino-2-deoxyglucuronate dehydrogenase
MKKLKFGLIGCGRISKKHFEAIAEIKNAEIIACSDILQERMDEAAQKYNISKKYPNYIDMFEMRTWTLL